MPNFQCFIIKLPKYEWPNKIQQILCATYLIRAAEFVHEAWVEWKIHHRLTATETEARALASATLLYVSCVN